MKTTRTVCYYISGHGLGHAARACQVIAKLPPDCRVLIRTHASPDFIRRECGRPVDVFPTDADMTPVQADNSRIDWPATVSRVLETEARRRDILKEERVFLEREKVDVVVSDIPSLPLEAACLAGIPSVAVGNFTWVDILEPAASAFPALRPALDRWKKDYRAAEGILRCGLDLPMACFRDSFPVGLIGRSGMPMKETIREIIGAGPSDRLVLVYFGIYGSGAVGPRPMDGVRFVGFSGTGPDMARLDPDRIHFPDVLASMDAVVAKPGYGTMSECMANGIPVVYHPRSEFAEYPALKAGLDAWGGAVEISEGDLLSGNWADALKAALRLSPVKVPAPGAENAAAHIMKLAARSS